ncbi:Uncharacterised protein [Pseudomonas aeruginosa]|nr:Uncharacterised protein [Pseudomonas aeruginosa]
MMSSEPKGTMRFPLALAIASLSVFDSPWFCWTLRSKPYFAWSPRKKLDAAIAGTIVHHQQFHVAVCLRSHAGNARFYVLFVVIGSDDHGNQWLRTIIDERHNYNLTCPSRPHSKRQTCMSDPAIFIGSYTSPQPRKNKLNNSKHA